MLARLRKLHLTFITFGSSLVATALRESPHLQSLQAMTELELANNELGAEGLRR